MTARRSIQARLARAGLVPDGKPGLDADLLAMIARYPALRAAADRMMADKNAIVTADMGVACGHCVAVEDAVASIPAMTPEGVLAKLVFAAERMGWDSCAPIMRLPLQAIRDAIRVGC